MAHKKNTLPAVVSNPNKPKDDTPKPIITRVVSVDDDTKVLKYAKLP
jgi:hypothetical protein